MLSARKLRRIAEQKARKQARKNTASTDLASPTPTPSPDPASLMAQAINPLLWDYSPIPPTEPQPEPEPEPQPISAARLAANQRNAALSTGPKLPSTKSISAQNSVTHGLARHVNGTFKVLANESVADFEAFKQSLFTEHSPASPTEESLVTDMAESYWLGQRAQRLQNTCVHPATGAITDAQMFTLYMRYQTTHTRAFHKSLSALQKLRSEQQKLANGFVAQKCLEDNQRIKNAQLEIKKQAHWWNMAAKEAEASNQYIKNRLETSAADRQFPGFREALEADLEKRGIREKAA